MNVTKVVVLVLRIPEQLSLYFSDFYTILCVFYKFASFDSSVYVRFSLRPLGFCFFSGEVPGGSLQNREVWRGVSRRGARRRRGPGGGGVRGGRALPI